MDENELTPEERMAFQRLPREAEPSQLLEERIVRSLRQEGILRPPGREADSVPGAGQAPGTEGRTSPGHRIWMLVGSVAASLILFGSGVFLGNRLGTESTSQAFIAVREQDAAQLALRIQEAGSDYVAALAALGQLKGAPAGEPGTDPRASNVASDLQQGSEVALGSLYGAAFELARLNPDDEDVLRVLQILEERRSREGGWRGESRNVVWF